MNGSRLRWIWSILVLIDVEFVGSQVEALVGQRVVQVSCGSRDAQTLALVEGKLKPLGLGSTAGLGSTPTNGFESTQGQELALGLGLTLSLRSTLLSGLGWILRLRLTLTSD